MNISLQIENFCGVSFTSTELHVSFASTELHVDAKTSRMSRDDSDAEKLSAWFLSHNSFPVLEYSMFLSTGVIGDNNINCHVAYKAGSSSLSKMVGALFNKITLKREYRVLSLWCVTSTIAVHDEMVPVNPETIFCHIAFYKNQRGGRKTHKSLLYNLFDPAEHRGDRALVVLDGYHDQNDKSTKSAEREHRRKKCSSADAVFDKTIPATMAKERFFCNECNKKRFITMMTNGLLAQNFEAKQAVEDADSTIISNALQLDQQSGTAVIVVGKRCGSSHTFDSSSFSFLESIFAEARKKQTS
ncbi:hypothetical protein ILUMI_06616 [Ignelater luminosus]|uniref:Uncharacterized protein n=1 Tax=Ignelater luminosus TaxID=2038154 RepID=A0A8K0GHK8_IGNLU|nr:hypothetical protein ILUMI_06616 [Ignelater luminosus]